MLLLNQRYDPAVPVGTLNLHPANPREGNVGLITQSIETVGFYGALIAQVSTGYILAGNHRYRSALENEAATVPVIWVDVPDDIAMRIMLVDNKANDDASNDQAALQEILRQLLDESGTLEGTGYTGDDLDELIADAERATAPINLPAEQPGPAPASRTDAPSSPRQRTCPQCGFNL